MKQYLTLSFLTLNLSLNSLLLFAQENKEKFIISVSKKTTIAVTVAESLVARKCERYLVSDPLSDLWQTLIDPYTTSACEAAAKNLFSILDVKTLTDKEGYVGRAVFTKKLIELIHKPETTEYLKTLLHAFEKDSNFSLFQTLTDLPHQLSPEKALEFIAVMLQDTNALQHIYYLSLLKDRDCWNENSRAAINFELLKKLNEHFQGKFYEYQNNHQATQMMDLYPDTSNIYQAPFQPALYHFYISGYLSLKLRTLKHGLYTSFMAPFALMVLYEQVFDTQQDLKNIDAFLIAISEKEPPIVSTYKQFDLYLSYSGSYWALHLRPLMDFENFSQNSSRNLPKTLRLLTKNL